MDEHDVPPLPLTRSRTGQSARSARSGRSVQSGSAKHEHMFGQPAHEHDGVEELCTADDWPPPGGDADGADSAAASFHTSQSFPSASHAAPIQRAPSHPHSTRSDGHTHSPACEAAHDPHGIGPPPDGGREAWLVVFACFFQQFCVFGMISANGQLQAYLLANQLKDYSKSDVSWLGSIQALIEFGGAMITGRYFDIHGPKLLVTSCLITSFGSFVGLAFSYKYWHFMLSFILFGISATLIYAPSAAVAAHWFERRRGLAVGIIVCGSGVGGVIYPIMFEQIFKKLSYRDTMLTVGCFNFALMLPGVLFMKSRLPPRTPPPWRDLRGPWRDKQYCLHVIGAAFFSINLLTGFFSSIPYARANTSNTSVTAYAVAICLGGSVVGRLGLGALADVLGVWRVFGALGFAAAITMFAFWLPHVGTAPTVVGLLFYGIIAGGWFTAVPAATAAISPVHEAGMRFGMLISSLAIPSLVGPVIASALITHGNDRFIYAAIFCGCTFAVSGLFTIAAGNWKRISCQGKRPATESVESGERPVEGAGEKETRAWREDGSKNKA